MEITASLQVPVCWFLWSGAGILLSWVSVLSQCLFSSTAWLGGNGHPQTSNIFAHASANASVAKQGFQR